MKCNQETVDFLVYKYQENSNIIQYIGLFVNIIVVITPNYFLIKFLILPIENKKKRKSEEDLQIGFETFKQSLKELKGGNSINLFAFDYTIFFEFYHNKYRIEVSEFANKKIIKLHWFDSENGHFVNERFINYKKEPTASEAVSNGPWF